mmetsp:Transcript_31611/g.72141  ORF Transcript_31611/g.72141 Transcript_31611/m.72141 type:complete len:491 (-) Transcript_31611:55-1527(-)
MALLGSAPLQLAQLLLLLRCKLAVTTTVEDVHLVTSGNERCSCATNVSQLPNASSTYSMPIGYGLGCYPHDRVQSPFPDCQRAPLADFCLRSWCYLGADITCELSTEVSWSTMYPGLRYSYETCGNFNSYQTFALENRLLGANLKVYLVTRAWHDNPKFWDQAKAAFKPFSMNLWLCILACIMLLSMVMVLEEHGKEDFKEISWWKIPFTGGFKGLESLFGGASTFHPHTAGGRVVQLGLGFFILLVVAGYTANLASMLVVQKGISTSINSIEEVIEQRVKVCADENLVTKVQRTFPEVSHLVHKVPNRSASLIMMGTECDAAVIRLQDLQAQHSMANFCGIVRVGDPLMFLQDGVATSSAIFRSLRLVVSDPNNGGIEQELQQSMPQDACGDSEGGTEEPSESLTVDSMYGAFLVAIAAMIMGVLLEMPRWLRHRRREVVLEVKDLEGEVHSSAEPEPSNWIAVEQPRKRKHDKPTQPQMKQTDVISKV